MDERRRGQLFDQLAASIGEEATGTLFEMLPPAGRDVVTSADIDDLRRELRHEMDGLRSEMREFRAEMRGEFGEFRAEMRGELHALRADFRGELNEALARNTRSMVLALAGTLVSTVGLAAVLSHFVG